jgi:hypothetical protein
MDDVLKELDIKVESEEDVVNYPQEALDAACPPDMRICGRLSKPEIFTCFKGDSPCPINSIVIDQNSQPPDDSYFSIFFGDSFFLHYSKDKVQNYLVSGDFRIEGSSVCMHSDERIGSFNNNDSVGSVIDECSKKVGGRKDDVVVVKLDQYSKNDLYNENDLTEIYTNNNFYNEIMKDSNSDLSLFNKPFMYFKESCQSEDMTNAEKINSRKYINLHFHRMCLSLIIFSSIGKQIIFKA